MVCSGGQVGGTVGYNRQLGNAVFGVEGDIDWSGLNGNNTTLGCPGGCSTSDSWLSTVRGRIGYSFDRVMPYVTGGLAVGDIRAATPGLAGGTSTNAGWTLGGGIEFALPGNWTAKAEYLRVDLGGFNCTGCSALPGDNVSTAAERRSRRRELSLRLGQIERSAAAAPRKPGPELPKIAATSEGVRIPALREARQRSRPNTSNFTQSGNRISGLR